MIIANVYDLKTNISKYLDLLANGSEKEIVIAKRGKRFAKIVAIEKPSKPRLGCAIGVLPELPYDLKSPEFDDIAEDFGLK